MISFGPGEAYALGCAVAWAAAVICFKRSGESLSPVALNLFKNLAALLLFALTVLWVEGLGWPSLPPGVLAVILLSGVLGIAVGDTLFFRALNRLGAGRMAVAQTLYSPFVILLSVGFLGERLGHWQSLGVLMVLAGIAWLGLERRLAAVDQRSLRSGLVLAVVAMLAMAAGIVMVKPILETQAFLWIVSLRILGGAAGLLLLTGLRGQWPALLTQYRAVRDWRVILLGTVIGSYLSMMLWLAGYKYTAASVAAILNELSAVFILLFAVVILREPLHRRQLLGMGLAVLGVGLVLAG